MALPNSFIMFKILIAYSNAPKVHQAAIVAVQKWYQHNQIASKCLQCIAHIGMVYTCGVHVHAVYSDWMTM